MEKPKPARRHPFALQLFLNVVAMFLLLVLEAGLMALMHVVAHVKAARISRIRFGEVLSVGKHIIFGGRFARLKQCACDAPVLCCEN